MLRLWLSGHIVRGLALEGKDVLRRLISLPPPAFQVHRSNKPIICKGCRRTFTSSLSQGLRRFGLCDSCTCVTTTHEDSVPINLSLMEPSSEGREKSDPDNDWPIYVESGDENDPPEDEDADPTDPDDKPDLRRGALM